MYDIYRVHNPAQVFDEIPLRVEGREGPAVEVGILDSDGSPVGQSQEPVFEDGAWDPFILGEPGMDYLQDVRKQIRSVSPVGIASMFRESSLFQPHLPDLRDLLDMRMQPDEFAKIISEILEMRFGGNVGAMAEDTGVEPGLLIRYAEGSALPKGRDEVYAIASGVSLDPERFSYAWIYSSLRGFEDARRFEAALIPEFFRMRIMVQSAAFLLGEDAPRFEKPVGRGAPDVNFSGLVDFMMMSLKAGFEEDVVYEIFSDCASYYPAVVAHMLEDSEKALRWFGGDPEKDAAVMTMIATLQRNSGMIEDAVTMEINAGMLLDNYKNGDPEFNRRIDLRKLEFYENAMKEAESIPGGVERLIEVGLDGTVDSLRRELNGEEKPYWVDDILSDPAFKDADGRYKPEAIERIFGRVFSDAMAADDPLFIDDAQLQNLAEMGRMVLMLGKQIPLESRLSFYHMQHMIARLRRGGAPAEELLNRYAPSMKGLIERRRAELDLDGAPLAAEEMAGQIADRLGGEYQPKERLDLGNAVTFAYLGILAGIELETAIATAASKIPSGADIYMTALEGANATIKKGHPYRAAITLAVGARRLAMDKDWCGAMQLYCAGGEAMTTAHKRLGKESLPVHELMRWMRSDFFDKAHEASKGHIPHSLRDVRGEFRNRISEGRKGLAREPHFDNVSGANPRTGDNSWFSFADAALAHRRVVAVEHRPIRAVPHWEPMVFSSGALMAGIAMRRY
ncbi:MAG: hypothetical protein WC683_00770 [bacterium]